jgi:hypothetical protein
MPKHQGVFETVGKAIKKVIGTPRKGAWFLQTVNVLFVAAMNYE